MSEKLGVSAKLKKRWKKEGKNLSLRHFARKLLKDGDKMASDWFDFKAGALNESRSEKNVTRINLESQATKAAKRKK